eukprot:jgi/Mesvir1/24112/Mv10832-RA.1
MADVPSGRRSADSNARGGAQRLGVHAGASPSSRPRSASFGNPPAHASGHSNLHGDSKTNTLQMPPIPGASATGRPPLASATAPHRDAAKSANHAPSQDSWPPPQDSGDRDPYNDDDYMWTDEPQPPSTPPAQSWRGADGRGGGLGLTATRGNRTLGGAPTLYVQANRRAVKHLAEKCRADIDAAQQAIRQAVEMEARATDILQGLEEERAGIMDELALLSETGEPVTHIHTLEAKLRECDKWAKKQHAACEEARAMRADAQQELSCLEMDATQLEEMEGEVISIEREEMLQRAELAAAQKAAEVKGVKTYEDRRRQKVLEAMSQKIAQEEQQQRVIEAAEEGRRRATARIKGNLARITEAAAEHDRKREAMLASRTQAVVELKKNSDAALEALKKRNAKVAAATRARQEAQAKEAEELLAAGKNPYEVFRRRAEEARVQRERAALQRAKNTRGMRIVRNLMAEEEEAARQAALRRQEQEHIDRFNAEMGVQAKQERVQAYLQSRAPATAAAGTMGSGAAGGETAGAFLLMPTGANTVHPSEISNLINKNKLGRGEKLPPGTLERVQKLYPESPTSLLVPRSLGAAIATLSATASGGVGRSGGGSEDDSSDMLAAEQVGAGYRQGGEAAPATSTLRAPKLSVLEREAMAAAKARHKESMTKKQIVWGREFKGAAFLPKPEIIEFKDFDVGKKYSQRVTLTNVSYTINTFKVTPMPQDAAPFFSIDYKFPGKMSAGMSCDLAITFAPQLNEDIFTVLPILAETGPIEVPVRCTTKKARVLLDVSELSFGAVTLQESASKRVKLTNDGALPTDFTVELLDGGAWPEADDSSERAQRINCFQFERNGHINGYASAYLDVAYTPRNVSPDSLSVLLRFSEPTADDVVLVVTGIGTPVPVHLDSHVLNFKACVYGSVYRAAIVAHNRSNTPLRCALVEHRELAAGGHVEFLPPLGFLQGKSSFTFQVKFSPSLAMKSTCAKFLRANTSPATLSSSSSTNNNDTGSNRGTEPPPPLPYDMLEVPYTLTVPGTQPLVITLRANLTEARLGFDPPTLQLDSCSSGEASAGEVFLRNLSALPTPFGFLSLPPGVTLMGSEGVGHDGFGTLLPGASACVRVTFFPPAAGSHTFNLECRTLLGTGNSTASLPVRCEARPATVNIEPNAVALPATGLNDIVRTSVIITNRSKVVKEFSFGDPVRDPGVGGDKGTGGSTGCGLRLSPPVGRIPPGKRLRVLVEFVARPSDVGLAPPVEAAPPEPEPEPMESPPAKKGGDKKGRDGKDGKDAKEGDKKGAGKKDAVAEEPKKKGDKDGGSKDKTADEAPSGAGSKKKDNAFMEEFLGLNMTAPPPAPPALDGDGAVIDEENVDGLMDMAAWEPWCKAERWIVPCRVRTQAGDEAGSGDGTKDEDEGGAIEASTQPVGSMVGGGLSPGEGQSLGDGLAYETLYLNVRTTAVEMDLALEGAGELDPADGCYFLDFGRVPLGQEKVLRVSVWNQSPSEVELGGTELHPDGSFALLAALRPVLPGGSHRVPLGFTPASVGIVRELYEIRCATCTLRVRMQGEGISPSLRIEGTDEDVAAAAANAAAAKGAGGGTKDGKDAGAKEGGSKQKSVTLPVTADGSAGAASAGGSSRRRVLTLGDTLVGDTAMRELTVTNISAFPVAFTAELAGNKGNTGGSGGGGGQGGGAPRGAPIAPTGRHNFGGGQSPFMCAPAGGIITSGAAVKLSVRFNPDHAHSSGFHDTLSITFANGEAVLVDLVAAGQRGW